jgi:hypothetical protein
MRGGREICKDLNTILKDMHSGIHAEHIGIEIVKKMCNNHVDTYPC